MQPNFRIGVNIFVLRDGRLLLGKRKNGFGAGEWGLPGGKLEFNEPLQVCGIRELKEETGMSVEELVFENLVNQPRDTVHYIQVGFKAINPVGEPVVMESDSCEEWNWFELDNLPEPIFSSHKVQIDIFRNKQNFAEGKDPE